MPYTRVCFPSLCMTDNSLLLSSFSSSFSSSSSSSSSTGVLVQDESFKQSWYARWAADLSARDVERAKFAFSIYDFEGKGTMDAFYVGDCLRALNLNPTLAVIEKVGGKTKKKEKMLKVDDFLPIFAQVKKDKDAGSFEDFMEVLKLYDKTENGTMLYAELEHILLSLGERLEKSELEPVLKDCCDEEDEDGFIPYEPFLQKLCKDVK
ncbi:hypothetical protein O3P69_000105 [Scylla paramamosain]|uniref:EF-hand domain-containing protein n=3 Tax=Scylla paramamosain TaxID=85552 RepID=A0AAW0UUN3_SCYPA